MSDSDKEGIHLIKTIENDEFYSNFLNSTPSNVMTLSLSINEQVKKLGEGIETVSKELQKQVLEKHNDLLKQANHVNMLGNVLNVMNGHVNNLLSYGERLRGEINTPYQSMEKHTKVLGRLHLASHILRQVSRIQHLSRRLSNTTDPLQKAVFLQELEQLVNDENLKGVDAVTSEIRNIRYQIQKVVQLANSSLNQGLLSENLAQTTMVLQIFINLGQIEKTIDNLVSSKLEDCRLSLKNAFDAGFNNKTNNANKNASRIQLASSQGFRAKIWKELDKALSEDILLQCKQIKFLHQSLLNINTDYKDKNIAFDFWKNLGSIIEEEICNSPHSVKQMLEEDYPKLLKLYCELSKSISYKYFVFDRKPLTQCENAYLSTTLNTLVEPIDGLFTGENKIPNHDDVDKIIRVISSQLSVALIEEELCEKIAKNVSKCIKMFALKIEQHLESGPDSAQVIGGSQNLAQQKNVELANLLFYFQNQIHRILCNMEDSLLKERISVIIKSLEALDNLIGNIIEPLADSIKSNIEKIIVTIHLEPDWNKLKFSSSKPATCGPYVRELSQFITRVFNTYLSKFENKEILLIKCISIATKCIDLFIYHSILIRPISEGGRERLKADYIQLETILKTLCPQLTELGKHYKLFKSISALILLPPAEITSSYNEGSVVPPSIILLLLFSYAGNELASPHQNTGWSISKLMAWLEEHPSESDRLDLIAGAIQRYEAYVRQKDSINYDPVYPVMSEFLTKVINSFNLK